MKLRSITLLGSSSGRNAGDAALMAGIMDSVDAAVGRRLTYEIPTIKPGFVRETYPNITRPISLMPWHGSVKMLGLPTLRSILRTDFSLIFDAILFDRSLYNPLFNFLSTLHLLLPLAKKRGKKLGCYNVGVGPVTTPQGRAMLKKLVEMMDFITVRDEDSLELLLELGVKNRRILLAADAALNAKSSSEERIDTIVRDLGLSPEKEILAININRYLNTWASPPTQPLTREAFLGIYADALNEAMSRIDAQLLFVCTQHHDIDITVDLMKRVSAPAKKALLDNKRYNPYEVKGVMGRASLLLGMRLHAMILASSALCPIIGLAYQPKVDYYFRSLGLRDYSLSFGDFNASSLSKHLQRGWAERHTLKEHVVKRVPALQQEAEKAAAIIASIDRGENTDHFFREP